MEQPKFSGENIKSEVDLRFQGVIKDLESCFGIKKLSNIELFHLRKIVEDVLLRVQKNNIKRNIETDMANINKDKEIMDRFLSEMYGIDVVHMNENANNDADEDGFNEYIRRTRERAHLI